MENIIIYSDESNHDKSITLKNDILNIDRENGSREYIRSYLAISEKELEIISQKFIDSENSLRRPGSNTSHEIKASQCLKISGTNGISKVEDKYIKHLTNLFNLLIDSNATCLVVSCNKIEYVVQESIYISIERLKRNYPWNSDLLNEETVCYSYSKFIQNYYTENLLKPLFLGENNTNYRLQKELTNINRELKSTYLKSKENDVGKTLIDLIKNNFVTFSPKSRYTWNYSLESELFLKKFNLASNEKKYSFLFDNGTKFKNVFEKKVIELGISSEIKDGNSKNETMIRVVDWIATFFGKLLRSYSNSFKIDKEADKNITLNTVIEINDNWFDLSLEEFELFKTISRYLKNNQLFFLGGILADNVLGIKNYIEYIAKYETYENFDSLDISVHGRNNNYLLNKKWDDFYFEKGIYFDSNDTPKGITYEHYLKNRGQAEYI